MPQNQDQNKRRNSVPNRRLSHAPYLIGAVFLHLVVFVLAATWVVFQEPRVPTDPATFERAKISPPPPPPPSPPQSLGGEAQSALEPDLHVTPPQALSSAVTSKNTEVFNLASDKVPQLILPSTAPAAGTGLSTTGATGDDLGAGSVFGSDNNNGNGFTGYFYDLKQTPDHQPTGMTATEERTLLKKFFAGGWDETEWATQFLKSPKPLYANELMIPFQSSILGPKSFGLGKVCQPGYWAAIYHAKITASRTGEFRVAGYGDDFLVVRIDGRVVLDSGYYPPVTDFKREKIYPSNWLSYHPAKRPDYGHTVVGSSFHMDTARSMTIDVFIGDADAPPKGGICGYFLFFLRDGKEYPIDAGGNPIFPLFQIQANPALQRTGTHVPFSVDKTDALLGP
jgi:hypothetical protein